MKNKQGDFIQIELSKSKVGKLRRTDHLLLHVCLTVFCSVLLILNACNQPTGEQMGNKITPINRFQVNSYTGNEDDRIKYSYTYDGYDFYYIYLGELRNIPIFHRNARYYAGNTQWIYEFSTTDIKEEEVRNIVENSSQEAIGIVKEHTYSKTNGENLTAEIGYKLKLGIVDIPAKIVGEDIWSEYTSDTSTNSFNATTSLKRTKEHAFTHTLETMESDKWIYTPADKVGYYRWTLFSASDVYLYVIRDSNDSSGIYYEFREHVIPNGYFWRMDYSETSSFRKSDATSFVIDVSILNNLPKTKIDLSDSNVQYYTIEYDANGAIGLMGSTVHFYGQAQNLRQNLFAPIAGYSFAGWARSPTATTAEFTDGQNILNLTDVRGASIKLYAVWHPKEMRTEIIEFPIGVHQFTFSKGFPATIEVYALGAGGGGQGGFRSYNWGWWGGTGGGGGGGAAAYVKCSVETAVTFNITVGSGGTLGTYKEVGVGSWQSGNQGGNGGNTTVSWGINNVLSVEGGVGGGGSGQNLDGGRGGRAGSTTFPAIFLDSTVAKGGDGDRGSTDNTTSEGGRAALITGKGSVPSFGGYLGGLRPAGQVITRQAQTGGGGAGEEWTRNGSSGGNGQVIIVFTY